MRKLPVVILLVLVALSLVTSVTGCHRAQRYDNRLVVADSLMRRFPDSALAIVEALCRDSLAAEGDHAYHDLLLTQARYKSYIPATSDSAINRALAYYRAHPKEREKLTRAYIYKGTVMEELGHPDSAMLYYKHAEATAAPDDYFNLGYAKLRIGSLYNDYYSMDGKDVKKYEEALACFTSSGDTVYQFICLNNLGCIYREMNPKRADSLLKQAGQIAWVLNDTGFIVSNLHALAVHDFYLQEYEECHKLMQAVLRLSDTVKDCQFLFMASNVYARLGLLDSASLFFRQATHHRAWCDASLYKVYFYESLGEIELAKRDTVASLKYSQMSERMADSLMANKEKLDIFNIEHQFDKEQLEQSRDERNHFRSRSILIVLLSLIALSAIVLGYYRRMHRYDKLIQALKQEHRDHAVDHSELLAKIDQLEIRDMNLKEFITAHTILLGNVLDACYRVPKAKLADEIKNIVEFQNKNKDNWERLYGFIDTEYNGLMKNTRENYPQLNDRDLLLLALTSMGYSCAQIAIIMGYSNASTIGGNRQRIARKMKFQGTLSDYIRQFKPKG